MKRNVSFTGILAIALVFVTLLFVGCKQEEEDNPFKGIWKASESQGGATLTFDDTTFKSVVGDVTISGTYTYGGNTAELTVKVGVEGMGINVGDKITATISGNTLEANGGVFTKQ